MIRVGNEALAPNSHTVLERPLVPPFPAGTQTIMVGMGCFWGAEKRFWQLDGVWTTAVGYAGGRQQNPDYRQVCSGATGHAEVVLVVYDDSPEILARVLQAFWESHDPTQGMRQGNDIGTQYRSCIFVCTAAQRVAAEATRDAFQPGLTAAGFGAITTEIRGDVEFWYAEDYHQQYLAKNPAGYCGLGGTGLRLPAVAGTTTV
jgi:peptide-methionine (S)-S-oxide reductase